MGDSASAGPRARSSVGVGENPPLRRLRLLLVGSDAVVASSTWLAALLWHVGFDGLRDASTAVATAVALATAATLGALQIQGLYLSRICSVRATEVAGAARAAIAGAGVLAMVAGPAGSAVLEIDATTVVVASAAACAALMAGRSAFRSWLDIRRRQGQFTTTVVVVGDNEEGQDLCRLVADHPETGFRVSGVVGPGGNGVWDARSSIPHLGPVDRAVAVAEDAGASGVIVAASALEGPALNALVRTCHRCGLHVHLSSGLRGIDRRRIRHRPVAHEPLLYVEPLRLAAWQQRLKRVIDVLGALVFGLAFLPLLAVAAVAIRLGDGGPVFFTQVRIGRGGQHFRIVKLRTMVAHAEALLDLVAADNERDGPLFKLASDPRRTRVGAVLERLSIDELPQLWNVLRGEMSLVGPRPALPEEADQFDDGLRERLRLLPGITGLWQIEARDNPSFGAYRRFDLFYVENWSVTLDIAILLGTVQSVLVRALAAMRHRTGAEPQPVPTDTVVDRPPDVSVEPVAPADLPPGVDGVVELAR